MLDRETVNNILLYLITGTGAVVAAIWLGLILWTWRDMRFRSRDPLAQIAASLMVAVLGIFGIVIYIMLRPPETLAEAYERSLEEEALLQNIEQKPVCAGCGRPIKDDWQVCPYCHTKLKKPCVNCGRLLELPWNLCPYCAAVQVYETQAAPGVRRAPRRSAPSSPAPAAEADAVPVETPEYVDEDKYYEG
ncbi:MAG TPA: zinc ribbon domain-containing protein [Aggregatilineaceae bacterium]|nr:zinc ribbon domain-containing protein [Aggregatilineaceae bacterium]